MKKRDLIKQFYVHNGLEYSSYMAHNPDKIIFEKPHRFYQFVNDFYTYKSEINKTNKTTELAIEIMKVHLAAQLKERRMSLIGRFKWWVGIPEQKMYYDINQAGIIKASISMADMFYDSNKIK